ncbi:MAG: bifunctional phosphoglucose/phosphomannose isomerase [Flavobacteriales bacterium]|jgi:glucose/mannose-6-phosphate isomerase|nr:bifunctional phosphoglucose/phosphomannose isomerase [Flavobacteriales bacterium]MBT5699498.1 bifunctional phosphoglucose/phosphomannose isomerase [Flavobacteriales bacterium]MDG2059237.1 bifunctional phosphoglucose/phosphomannose isomerase [Flavobacteriales bacterium]
MKMNDYINDFTNHLTEAMEIGDASNLKKSDKKFNNILICGLGGSGIGGTIINDIISSKANIPILATKDYSIPNFVDENTLVIASSYSGNTEETIYALEKCQNRNTEICIITSGGKLKTIAEENNYNHIIIPGGHPPRAMFGYAFTELFYVLNHYGIIDNSFKSDFTNSISLLNSEKEDIQDKAMELAKKMYQKTPVIYVAQGFEGVAVRFRQQINENSKMLCWHHVVPEMNHNELLGWRTNVDDLAVVYFRNKSDFDRNQIRMDINRKVISKFTNNITEVWSKGDSQIENTLYHINLGDWVSWYLSEMNNVDAIEIDVINFLKGELSKV